MQFCHARLLSATLRKLETRPSIHSDGKRPARSPEVKPGAPVRRHGPMRPLCASEETATALRHHLRATKVGSASPRHPDEVVPSAVCAALARVSASCRQSVPHRRRSSPETLSSPSASRIACAASVTAAQLRKRALGLSPPPPVGAGDASVVEIPSSANNLAQRFLRVGAKPTLSPNAVSTERLG